MLGSFGHRLRLKLRARFRGARNRALDRRRRFGRALNARGLGGPLWLGARYFGSAYRGWVGGGGIIRIREITSGIVIWILVTGMAGDIIRRGLRDFFQRFAFPLQGLHFALERGFKIARGATEFSDRLSDRSPKFWKLLRPKQNEGDDENNDHLLYAERTEHLPSSFLCMQAHRVAPLLAMIANQAALPDYSGPVPVALAFARSTIAATSASNFLASYTIPSLIVYLMPPTRSERPVWSFSRIAPVPYKTFRFSIGLWSTITRSASRPGRMIPNSIGLPFGSCSAWAP